MDNLFRESKHVPKPLTPGEIVQKIDEARTAREPGLLLSALVKSIETENMATPEALANISALGSLIVAENQVHLDSLPVLESDVARTELPPIVDMIAIGERLKSIGESKDIQNWGQAIVQIELLKKGYNEEMTRRLRKLQTKKA